MQKTMLDYINEQPSVLGRMVQQREEYTAPFVDFFAKCRPDKLYIVASGSSYNASLAAVSCMQAVLGMEVQVNAASRLPVVYSKQPLILYVSQGGRSSNTINAQKELAKFPSLAMTGEEKCPLNDVCDACIQIPCGAETVGPKTKGYTATVLLLCLCALEAAKKDGRIQAAEYEQYVSLFSQIEANLSRNIDAVAAWYGRNEKELEAISKCVVVGKGVGADIAVESALKLLETVLVPAASYEFEEFLHGPDCALDANMAGFYLLPPKEDADFERMNRLAAFHRTLCPMVYVFGDVQGNDPHNCIMQLAGNLYADMYSLVTPCQYVGALLPAKLDREGAGHKIFVQLDAALNIKYKEDKADEN